MLDSLMYSEYEGIWRERIEFQFVQQPRKFLARTRANNTPLKFCYLGEQLSEPRFQPILPPKFGV
jgi:hypothetical protein